MQNTVVRPDPCFARMNMNLIMKIPEICYVWRGLQRIRGQNFNHILRRLVLYNISLRIHVLLNQPQKLKVKLQGGEASEKLCIREIFIGNKEPRFIHFHYAFR